MLPAEYVTLRASINAAEDRLEEFAERDDRASFAFELGRWLWNAAGMYERLPEWARTMVRDEIDKRCLRESESRVVREADAARKRGWRAGQRA